MKDNGQVREMRNNIEEYIRSIFNQDKYPEYLKVVSKFSSYSVDNAVLITMKKPESTLLATFDNWKSTYGRFVLKNEESLRLLAPYPIREKVEIVKLNSKGEPSLDKNGVPLLEEIEVLKETYKTIPVFDVSQTNGRERVLPQKKDNYEILKQAIVESSPIEVEFVSNVNENYYDRNNKKIILKDHMKMELTIKSLVDLIPYAVIQNDLSNKSDSLAKQIEATSISYSVSKHFDIDAKNYNFDVRQWSSNKNIGDLREVLHKVNKTTDILINSINERYVELEREAELKPKPIEKSDVIVMISAQFESDYSINKITNMDRNQVKAKLQELITQDADEELDINNFFESYGANIETIKYSNGVMDEYPIFYDLQYDLDNNKVYDLLDSETKERVEYIIARVEFGRRPFNEEEKETIMDYFEKSQSIEDAKSLAYQMQEERDLDSSDVNRTIENAYQESKDVNQSIDREEILLHGDMDMYGIYQLKDSNDLRYHRFENYDALINSNLKVDKKNYELIYSSRLEEKETLDDIFERFNMFHPEDFRGHSLSISDIVLVHKNGINTAHYVDGAIGFRTIPDFLLEEEKIKMVDFSDVKRIELGDTVFLYNGGRAIDIADTQDLHVSWRKDLKGLSSTGELIKFNANQIETIRLRNGDLLERKEEPYISQYYVIEDIQTNKYQIQKYDTYKEAKDAYFLLPYNKLKALGVENIKHGSLDFIQCKFGIDTPIMDCKKVDGWNNSQIFNLVEQIQIDVFLHEREEMVYLYDGQYLTIQTNEEGYDYSLYNNKYELIDGGIYEDPDVTLWEAARDILSVEDVEKIEIIDYDEVESRTEEANRTNPLAINEDIAGTAQNLTFYVAECMEYPTLGEYHDDLTFDQAVQIFNSIPSDRINGIKGIGFELRYQGKEGYSTFGLMDESLIDVDIINHIKEFRENKLIQQAVNDIIERFPDIKVLDRETKARETLENKEIELAIELDQFAEDSDPYEYRDAVEDKESSVNSVYSYLHNGDVADIKEWLQGVIDLEESEKTTDGAKQLIMKLDDLVEKRERNPLAKVEELEESNYNQIDGVLNNIKPKEQINNGSKQSIKEKLEQCKNRVSKDKDRID